jgi:hypothetical protein
MVLSFKEYDMYIPRKERGKEGRRTMVRFY